MSPEIRPAQAWARPIAPLALTAVALAIRLYRLGEQSLWFDEAYTAWIARLPLSRAWEALLADGVHPPLFYLLQMVAKGWAGSELGLRLPSALLGATAVLMLFLLADRWLGRPAAWLAGLLAALSPFQVWHSQDARMYAMLAAANVACILTFDRLLTSADGSAQVLFVLSHAITYSLHYFGLMLPLVELVFLIWTLRENGRRLRLWTLLQLLAALPLLVWVVALAGREANIFGIGWIQPPLPRDLVYTLMNLTIGYAGPPTMWQWAGLAVCVALLLLGALAPWPSANRKRLALLWAALPILLTYALSLRRPVYMDRFLIGSGMPLLLLLAAGAMWLPRRPSIVAGAILVAAFGLGLTQLWFGAGNVKEQWRQAAAALAWAGPEEVIAIRVLQIAVPLRYYDHGPLPLRPVEANRIVNPIEDLARGASGTWLAYWNASADPHRLTSNPPFDPARETDPSLVRWLAGEGPPLIERMDFVGVTLLHYGALP
ncbi:MAG: glycosyltransferase family 39 protein [Chloroflexota bacterium]